MAHNTLRLSKITVICILAINLFMSSPASAGEDPEFFQDLPYSVDVVLYDPDSPDHSLSTKSTNMNIRLVVKNGNSDFTQPPLHFRQISLYGIEVKRLNDGENIVLGGRGDYQDVLVKPAGTTVTEPSPWLINGALIQPGLYLFSAPAGHFYREVDGDVKFVEFRLEKIFEIKASS